MKNVLLAVVIIMTVAAIGLPGPSLAWTDTNWTASTLNNSKEPECRLSSGGPVPDLDNTPIFINFFAIGDRTEVTLGGGLGGAGHPSDGVATITFKLDQFPATWTYQTQWGIIGPDPFLMPRDARSDEFFAQAQRAKTLHIGIANHDFPVSLFGFEIAFAQLDDCKIRRGKPPMSGNSQ